MSKLFPPMTSRPEKLQIFGVIPCMVWAFVLFPLYMPFLADGLWEQWQTSAWLEIGFHVINAGLMLLIMRSYLKEEWFMLTTDVGFYLKHVGITVGLIAITEAVLLYLPSCLGFDITYLINSLPVSEFDVIQTPLSLIDFRPVFGTVALSLFAPISVCLMIYGFCFAPLCERKPWLAYLSVALITLIPIVVDIIWRGELAIAVGAYIVRLPIHLFACWSYQKTDNVWTPMISLVITNLLSCVVLIILMFVGSI